MRPGLVFAILALSMFGLTGCSRDVSIVGDYKLYDLDGSNQSIIGHKGMVAIHNVTGFATTKPVIYVEVGGGISPSGRGADCSYKLIDTSKHSVIDLPAGTPAEATAIAAISAQKQGLVSRACASPA